ncbi:hypothetical protein [Sphingomonas pituitosa]|uniref:hypothetical protein n=1 Tax=Sphingomonas pituitosa TaxID=99597 RepID=UPI00083019BF|nr:hypothetical protein [Sphingomonas pituitosa]
MRQPINIPTEGSGTMMLMPAREGTCEICATAHKLELPHNAQSLFYQTRFNIEHGRAPDWRDAMAHCSDEMRALWTEQLTARGVDVEGGAINPAKTARKAR